MLSNYFSPGDVVWARPPRHPYWPAEVTAAHHGSTVFTVRLFETPEALLGSATDVVPTSAAQSAASAAFEFRASGASLFFFDRLPTPEAVELAVEDRLQRHSHAVAPAVELRFRKAVAAANALVRVPLDPNRLWCPGLSQRWEKVQNFVRREIVDEHTKNAVASEAAASASPKQKKGKGSKGCVVVDHAAVTTAAAQTAEAAGVDMAAHRSVATILSGRAAGASLAPSLGSGHIMPVSAVGVVHSMMRTHLSAPRQPSVPGVAHQTAVIKLARGFENAVRDLKGFERLWIVFHFNYSTGIDTIDEDSTGWKPLVVPPRDTVARGLFATRSPHRPNAIGLSCVRLVDVKGLEVHIADHDLLHGTPVLDIKPYLPFCDAHPTAKAGWVEELDKAGRGGADHRPRGAGDHLVARVGAVAPVTTRPVEVAEQ